MKKFYLGTAGWSYEDWEGIVYPPVRGRGFHPLEYLAHFVDLVEINSTFYRPATPGMAYSWLRRIQAFARFLFTVKLLQIFTHQRKDFSQKEVTEFKKGIEPLAVKQRLAAILIQFPWSFSHTAENLEYLEKLFTLFSEFPLALEVRHGSWDRPDFHEFLKEHRVCFCNIDQPIFQNSIKPSAVVTNPLFSYVRLHGRNYKDWFREGAGRDDRYNYLYTTDELKEWIGRIRKLAEGSDRVFVITNNHYRGQALANALQIKNMLTGEKLQIPVTMLEKYPVLKEIAKKLEKGQFDLFEESQESGSQETEKQMTGLKNKKKE
ncbi:MAG: DUF72 domain-containing protein [Candidatus Saccharicenans sp.]|nr:DUF72 domain-containing protein [Candidatus Saccharicenans sp.]MDI6849485.1 DUF72 domain-containing protein [Candidatus Saccharicenans sp.]